MGPAGNTGTNVPVTTGGTGLVFYDIGAWSGAQAMSEVAPLAIAWTTVAPAEANWAPSLASFP